MPRFDTSRFKADIQGEEGFIDGIRIFNTVRFVFFYAINIHLIEKRND